MNQPIRGGQVYINMIERGLITPEMMYDMLHARPVPQRLSKLRALEDKPHINAVNVDVSDVMTRTVFLDAYRAEIDRRLSKNGQRPEALR